MPNKRTQITCRRFHCYQLHDWGTVSNGKTMAWISGLEREDILNCLLYLVNCTRNSNSAFLLVSKYAQLPFCCGPNYTLDLSAWLIWWHCYENAFKGSITATNSVALHRSSTTFLHAGICKKAQQRGLPRVPWDSLFVKRSTLEIIWFSYWVKKASQS